MSHSAKIIWLLYFWFLMVSTIIGMFFEPFDMKYISTIPLSAISLIGVWGYVQQRAIWRIGFWRVAFWLLVAGSALAMGFTLLSAAPEIRLMLIVGAVIGTAFYLPALIAIWAYAFTSPKIWEKPLTKASKNQPKGDGG